MKKYLSLAVIFTYAATLAFVACKKKSEEKPANPFDDPTIKAPAPQTNTFNPSPTSFEYIYQNVFNVTCNNSGCHDGNFEPDFRNMSSAYNSLVYAPVLINTPSQDYEYRVLPGDASKSLLRHRLVQMPGMGIGTLGQGRMPWNDTMWMYVPKHATYIQNLTDWINQGAKDMFGNSPSMGNKHPNTLGLQITNAGSPTPFARPRYINISKSNGPVDIWLYVVDDVTAPQNLTNAEIKFSTNRYDFTNAVAAPVAFVPSGPSYQEMTLTQNVTYNYKLSSFSLNTIQADTGYIFMRTYFKDEHHDVPSETPNDGSKYYTDYFIIKITP